MDKRVGPKISDAQLIADAAKYATKIAWVRGNNAWYHLCKRRSNKLFAKAAKHMTPNVMSMADVFLAAAKFSTKKEWRANDPKSYNAAHMGIRKGRWSKADYARMCSHMGPTKSNAAEPRCVYVATLHSQEGSFVYVGLTNDPAARFRLHRIITAKYSWLFNHSGVSIAVGRMQSAEAAGRKEVSLIRSYRNNPDWICLNVSDGGTFGGAGLKTFKTKREAVSFAKQFDSSISLKKTVEGRKFYAVMVSRGWWQEIVSKAAIKTFNTRSGGFNYYKTKTAAIQFAKTFSSVTEMRMDKDGSKFYSLMSSRGWLKEVCEASGLATRRKAAGYWTLKTVLGDARTHANLSDWLCKPSYKAAHRMGVVSKIRNQILLERTKADA